MKLSPPPAARALLRPIKQPPRRRSSPPPPPLPALPFHAFLAYADVSAAGRAMETINGVLRAARGKHALRPMLWRFNQLTDPKWRERAIVDAAVANVVVLASTSAKTLTAELEAWIGDFLAYNRGRRTTIVALFGDEDAWTISIEEASVRADANAVAEQRLVA
jgi:hypothetical protein